MSTLKVNKLRDTAGSADAITLDPNGGAVLAGVTTVTSVKVGAAVTISESGIEASGIGITVANINGGQISGRRNIIINGAMNVAQRGTSSTTSGFGSVDRFAVYSGSVDEAPTHEQVDVASGTSPYTSGFRKALKVTNGDQSNGAGTSDYILVRTTIEAQDIANSGWNYTSTSSFLTFSFWIKSSVAQNFHGHIRAHDGGYNYPFETGSLSADTWTKVIKTIPGNSNLAFDHNTEAGLAINFAAFFGTDYTSGVSNDEWINYASANLTPDQTATWYTTNDATLEITGVQLEVGSQATAFEHRSIGELSLCQRYFYMHANGQFDLSSTDRCPIGLGYGYTTTDGYVFVTFPTRMRSNPSLYKVVGTDYFNFAYNNNNGYPNDISANRVSNQVCELNFHTGSSWDQNAAGMFRTYNTAARIGFDAELS